MNSVVSLRAYPEFLRVVSVHGEMVDLVRSFDRDQTFYDWQHYITLIERKPGALRNGAPFKTMPEPLQELQRQPSGRRAVLRAMRPADHLRAQAGEALRCHQGKERE